jgi:hypothetical protein
VERDLAYVAGVEGKKLEEQAEFPDYRCSEAGQLKHCV